MLLRVCCHTNAAVARSVQVRQLTVDASNRNQLVVLLVIDNPDSAKSILATQSVTYVKGKMATQSYMDGYPFPFYIIVRNVRALPDALSDALRQWFEAMTASKA
jgi:midasin